MNNGCPKCEELRRIYWGNEYPPLCLSCQIEQADADLLKAMNRLEELKRQKKESNDI